MKTLFDIETRTRCHKADPVTSYEAADKMIKSGRLEHQERDVLRCIQSMATDNFTAKEIPAYMAGLDYVAVSRRLSDLRKKGYIRRTGEKRNGCCVLEITNESVRD